MTQPTLKLERLNAGELSDAAREGAVAALSAEEREILSALPADDAEILRRYPPRVVAIEVRRRAAARRRTVPMALGGLAFALTAATALLLVVPPSDEITAIEAEDGVRLKGTVTLLVHRRTMDGEQRLPEGAPARAGDQLQLEIQPASADHAVLVSIDGRGAVTRHLPIAGTRAAPVDPGRKVALPTAYQLDDAPSFERFFLVVGRGSFDAAPIEEAARALTTRPDRGRTGDLAVPAHLVVDTHLVVKEGP